MYVCWHILAIATSFDAVFLWMGAGVRSWYKQPVFVLRLAFKDDIFRL